MSDMVGGCQCGALRYAITGKPLMVYACHCTQCQTQSGSAFGLSLGVARADFAVTKGTPATWSRTTERGTVTICYFCKDCGTRIVHERQGGARVMVRGGTLDDTSCLTVMGHIWVSSAQPWLRPLLTGPHVYEEQPPDVAIFGAISPWAASPAAG
ncbi:MAG TPA: GFA family protein [Xanthobacteraceae bacterium]|nr:GFA family protein [Xanthobacteraceae bacterium]